jgi:hypothetical protein
MVICPQCRTSSHTCSPRTARFRTTRAGRC